MRVLVVNPGSSSLKLSLLDAGNAVVAEENLPAAEGEVERSALEAFLERAPDPGACGVRVVHGGREFLSSVRVAGDVLARLEAVADLAPLHNPPALHALRVLRQVRPSLALVACFDTAFHAGMPEAAAVYAVPWRWTAEWGIRRYGFHGLSHSYASRRTAELLGRDLAELRLVTCHLGAGASLCAVRGGASVDTTMGFTPMEGLVMATRSGSLDPGALLWAQRRARVGPDEVERLLDRESGLLGVSGLSADMREVLSASERGHRRARLALEVYLHRLRASVAAMAAALEGIDALVFTGGVGERSPAIRSAACRSLRFLGVAVDEDRNRQLAGDGLVGAAGAEVQVAVVEAREDLEIAREVRRLLAQA